MAEVILTENPFWNPRRRSHKRAGTHRRSRARRHSRRNPVRRGRKLSLSRIMSPSGLTQSLDLMHTGGIVGGLIGFQKLSEAINQHGWLDAGIVIGASLGVSAVAPRGKLVDGLVSGGLALGLLKIIMLIPGTAALVSAGSMVLGSRATPMLPTGPTNAYPASGVRNKITLAG